MGEERIWAELNQVKTDVGKIGADVTEIKDALLGDRYGNKGYADRICELEDHCEMVKDEIHVSKIYRRILVLLGSLVVGSGGIFGIVKFILPLITK